MSKKVESYHGKGVGQDVIALIGPWKGQRVHILEIEIESGARNGWFTVRLPNGKDGLFAGEELA